MHGERGWLIKSEWDVAGAPNVLDMAVTLRNNIGHGRPQLLQQISIEGTPSAWKY